MFEGIKSRGRKEESKLKIERIPVQVTKAEKELITKIAASKGFSSVSEYIRMVCIYEPFNNFFDGGK